MTIAGRHSVPVTAILAPSRRGGRRETTTVKKPIQEAGDGRRRHRGRGRGDDDGGVGSFDEGRLDQVRRHPQRRLGAVVRRHRQLRPDRRVPRRRLGRARRCEVKTLVGYEHAAGAAGNKIVPDLATSVPKPTNGGKTYTFHLKPDIKFGPPVNREITSQDFVTAMERLANPKDGGEYAFYYTVIKGWNAYARRQGEDDLGHLDPERHDDRLQPDRSRPVTSSTGWRCPPRARCRPRSRSASQDEPGKYGQDLISTRPVHAQRDRQRSTSRSCAAIKPDTSGYDGQTIYDLVRNPN